MPPAGVQARRSFMDDLLKLGTSIPIKSKAATWRSVQDYIQNNQKELHWFEQKPIDLHPYV